WLRDFKAFEKWAKEYGYKEGLTIERIDYEGDYSPENCKWIKPEDQSRNRRGNIFIKRNGEIKTLKEWCDKYELNYKVVHQSMGRRNVDGETALNFYLDKLKELEREK